MIIESVKVWASQMRFNDWISFIASICSIVALPIAIWQIVSVKSKVDATEDGIRKILSVKEHEKLEAVLAVVKNQHSSLVKLQSQMSQPGSSKRSLEEKANSIIEELNRSVCDMPVKEESISKTLRSAIECIRKYSQDVNNLRDAEAFLYSSIQELKTRIEDYREQEIENAKH